MWISLWGAGHYFAINRYIAKAKSEESWEIKSDMSLQRCVSSKRRIKLKSLFVFLVSVFCVSGFMQQGSLAVPIFGNGPLGSFEGDIRYSYSNTSPTATELKVTIENTSDVNNGGYITAFAFNNPSDSISRVSLSSSDTDFQLIGGSGFDNSINAMPYGDFDIGVSLSNRGNNPFQGGGNPQKGIGVGIEETFTFSLTVTALSNLNIQDFLGELSIGNATGKQPAFFLLGSGDLMMVVVTKPLEKPITQFPNPQPSPSSASA